MSTGPRSTVSSSDSLSVNGSIVYYDEGGDLCCTRHKVPLTQYRSKSSRNRGRPFYKCSQSHLGDSMPMYWQDELPMPPFHTQGTTGNQTAIFASPVTPGKRLRSNQDEDDNDQLASPSKSSKVRAVSQSNKPQAEFTQPKDDPPIVYKAGPSTTQKQKVVPLTAPPVLQIECETKSKGKERLKEITQRQSRRSPSIESWLADPPKDDVDDDIDNDNEEDDTQIPHSLPSTTSTTATATTAGLLVPVFQLNPIEVCAAFGRIPGHVDGLYVKIKELEKQNNRLKRKVRHLQLKLQKSSNQ